MCLCQLSCVDENCIKHDFHLVFLCPKAPGGGNRAVLALLEYSLFGTAEGPDK